MLPRLDIKLYTNFMLINHSCVRSRTHPRYRLPRTAHTQQANVLEDIKLSKAIALTSVVSTRASTVSSAQTSESPIWHQTIVFSAIVCVSVLILNYYATPLFRAPDGRTPCTTVRPLEITGSMKSTPWPRMVQYHLQNLLQLFFEVHIVASGLSHELYAGANFGSNSHCKYVSAFVHYEPNCANTHMSKTTSNYHLQRNYTLVQRHVKLPSQAPGRPYP